jgi:hypothetical protein
MRLAAVLSRRLLMIFGTKRSFYLLFSQAVNSWLPSMGYYLPHRD